MDTVAFVLFLLLTGAAIVQAFLMGLQTWEHRRFTRSRFRGLNDCRATGRAMVFAPCKGLDAGLEENLGRLFEQDYHDYEITFVVQSDQDPACPLIDRLRAEHPGVPSHLVVAGPARASGQKVHNLRVATSNLDERIDHLVFVDSDARPGRHWLRALLSRLTETGQERIGAVTGYRWFIPRNGNVAASLVAGINCRIAMLFGSRANYPVWGGSWAIRREVFDEVGLPQAWSGTLSDDLVATNLLHRRDMRVRFEPTCMVASPLEGTALELFSFLRRQFVIGRFYVPVWWGLGLSAVLLPNLAWIATLATLGWALATGSPLVWVPLVAAGAMYGLNVATALIRHSLAGLHFPDLRDGMTSTRRLDTWAGPLVGLVNALGMIASIVGSRFSWRGITYRLLAGGRIQIVKTDEPGASAVTMVGEDDSLAVRPAGLPVDLQRVA